MAWVAVDKDGTEKIHSKEPERGFEFLTDAEIFECTDTEIVIPKGSIKKLTGLELTFADEPVELKNDTMQDDKNEKLKKACEIATHVIELNRLKYAGEFAEFAAYIVSNIRSHSFNMAYNAFMAHGKNDDDEHKDV